MGGERKKKEREKRTRKKKIVKRRKTSDTSWKTLGGAGEEKEKGNVGMRDGTRGRPRSCVAQRETFNSVTLGLNYHAETIVPGKIKKGALPARRRAPSRRGVPPSQNHAQSPHKEERGSWNTMGWRDEGWERERARRTTTKSLFRLQDRLLRSV